MRLVKGGKGEREGGEKVVIFQRQHFSILVVLKVYRKTTSISTLTSFH